METSMRCEQFEQFLEQEPDSVLSPLAELHIVECQNCFLLWNDIQLIRELGKSIAAEESDPPRRIWVALRAQLESEGIIREAQPSRWLGGLFVLSPRSALAGAFLVVMSVALTVATYNPGDQSAVAAAQQSPATVSSLTSGIGTALDGNVGRIMASLP